MGSPWRTAGRIRYALDNRWRAFVRINLVLPDWAGGLTVRERDDGLSSWFRVSGPRQSRIHDATLVTDRRGRRVRFFCAVNLCDVDVFGEIKSFPRNCQCLCCTEASFFVALKADSRNFAGPGRLFGYRIGFAVWARRGKGPRPRVTTTSLDSGSGRRETAVQQLLG